MPTLVEQYRRAFASHEALALEARGRLPDGVTSDSRRLDPFPLYIDAARGARKWDRDGREFIDLWSGHGSLLFGHAAPELVEAAGSQLQRGTHFGACHSSAAQWAALICELVPSAERVRFTASGTEAVLLALHVARAYTGRVKVLRFEGHYHGWYADLNVGSGERGIEGRVDPVVDRARGVTITCPNDLDAAAAALRAHPEIGAVILEPTGPCSGVIPLGAAFLEGLRDLTRAHGAVLIFDEIVTGFRLGAGGAQGLYGVQPDLTTLAKIVAGGLPGGALTGRGELLELLAKGGRGAVGIETRRGLLPSIPHLGTFSGNPVSAAAGVATLRRIVAERPYEDLARAGDALREELNRVIDGRGLDWVVYGQGSCLKLLLGHGAAGRRAVDVDVEALSDRVLLSRGEPGRWGLFRLALLLQGLDMSLSSFITTAHTPADREAIVEAFDAALVAFKREA